MVRRIVNLLKFVASNVAIWILIFIPSGLFDGTVPPSAPYKFNRYAAKNFPAEIKCLANNIYYEGRGEPYEGQVAIANATVNRVRYEAYPTTICAVVYQPGQFTWTKEKHNFKNPFSWYQSLSLAKTFLRNNRLDNVEDNTKGAVSFHVLTVHPDWSPMVKTVTIGHHVFYKPVAQPTE